MIRLTTSIVISVALLSVARAEITRQEPGVGVFDETAALEKSQAAIGRTLSNYQLVDHNGRAIKLQDFRGKPLVISLIYTSCHHTCPMMTVHLARAIEIAREALGEDSFAALTIGFDTATDNPDRMRMFANERGIDTSRWTFASTDARTIEALTEALGFTYFRSPRGFDHLAQTSILDARGMVSYQVYGETIHVPTFVEPLKRLVWGVGADATSLSGWIKGVRLFCTVYDPSTGRYTFDYSIFIAATVGILSLAAIAIFVLRNARQSRLPHKTV